MIATNALPPETTVKTLYSDFTDPTAEATNAHPAGINISEQFDDQQVKEWLGMSTIALLPVLLNYTVQKQILNLICHHPVVTPILSNLSITNH